MLWFCVRLKFDQRENRTHGREVLTENRQEKWLEDRPEKLAGKNGPEKARQKITWKKHLFSNMCHNLIMVEKGFF